MIDKIILKTNLLWLKILKFITFIEKYWLKINQNPKKFKSLLSIKIYDYKLKFDNNN
jgi:hypothetical protein